VWLSELASTRVTTATEEVMTQTDTQSRTENRSTNDSPLVTEQGKTTIADEGVEKVAGTAAREVNGVHAMGGSAARALGTIKEKLSSSSGPSPSQGVSVEVGERQAAIDLDLVVEFGASIIQLASAVRRNVINRVQQMTGLEVTEVNITVNDVWLGEDDMPTSSEPRVE